MGSNSKPGRSRPNGRARTDRAELRHAAVQSQPVQPLVPGSPEVDPERRRCREVRPGDVTPVVTEGRVAAMALMLLGIGLFGAITATITSYLMTRDSHQGSDHSLASSNGWWDSTLRGH